MSPQAFSYVFAFDSFGYMLFGFAAGRASQRLSVRDTLIVGLVMCELGAVGVLITAMLHLPVVAVVLSLFILVSGTAVTSPSPTSGAVRPPKAQRVTPITEEAVPATSGYPVRARDLVGGASSAISLGLITLGCAGLAEVFYTTSVRHRPQPPGPVTTDLGGAASPQRSGRTSPGQCLSSLAPRCTT